MLMKRYNYKKFIGIAMTIVAALFIILIGPFDYFKHGFFCDVVPYEDILQSDIEYVDLGTEEYCQSFMPIEKHFVGFEINIANNPEENSGFIDLIIHDDKGNFVDKIEVALTDVTEKVWYKVYTNKQLKENHIYELTISARDCNVFPQLQIVDSSYLSEENISGNLLIGYAYAESTFTMQNKILIIIFIFAIYGYLLSTFFGCKKIKNAAFFVFLTGVLAWNYMYNSMDNQNTSFEKFQWDSETLVAGPIMAEHNGVWNGQGYGLGTYIDVSGFHTTYGLKFYSDEMWENGYSKENAAICLPFNSYNDRFVKNNYYIEFSNGVVLQIKDVTRSEKGLIVSLLSDEILSESKYGNLSEVSIYNENMEMQEKGIHSVYISQYGLQGKIFRHLSRYMNYEEVLLNLRLFCSMAMAIVFTTIVFLLWKKYNIWFAGCFFITFWLSPWIVNFARNLYWVEFTWFLPMAVGIFTAYKIENRKCRWLGYIGTFISIFIRCLCGYEYISSIMMGLIAFLVVDFAVSIVNKEFKKSNLLFRTIIIIGIIAVAAFMAAICIHANVRGSGSVIEGIKKIYAEDVLRRTRGADLNNFNEVYWPSMNASVWEVLCKYFKFSTPIITGISGNLFPILCIIPLHILAFSVKDRKAKCELLVMYIVFFFTTISWYILGKGHSYIHTHMNYVLWYIGYIQICLYIIVDWIRSLFDRNIKGK